MTRRMSPQMQQNINYSNDETKLGSIDELSHINGIEPNSNITVSITEIEPVKKPKAFFPQDLLQLTIPKPAPKPVVQRPVVQRPVVQRPVVQRPAIQRPAIQIPVAPPHQSTPQQNSRFAWRMNFR